MKKVLIEKKQSGKRRIEYHADGIDLHHLHADKGGEEELIIIAFTLKVIWFILFRTLL